GQNSAENSECGGEAGSLREYGGGQCGGADDQGRPSGNVEWNGGDSGSACSTERTGSPCKQGRNPGESLYQLHLRIPDVQGAELELDRRSARGAAERDCCHGDIQRI